MENNPLRKNEPTSWIDTVWDALQGYRENCISEDDDQWDDICTAMAWITEEIITDDGYVTECDEL